MKTKQELLQMETNNIIDYFIDNGVSIHDMANLITKLDEEAWVVDIDNPTELFEQIDYGIEFEFDSIGYISQKDFIENMLNGVYEDSEEEDIIEKCEELEFEAAQRERFLEEVEKYREGFKPEEKKYCEAILFYYNFYSINDSTQ